jgi:hypothetical protein
MLAIIMQMKPEIFGKKLKDGSTFQASDSFVPGWLHKMLSWSMRKATQAAHKHPSDWEDQCEKSFFHKSYVIKEEDIPPELYVNSDQTQVVYAPGNRMTWADTGAKQVSVIGIDEKCAFTVMVSVAANGTLLPFQAIYEGMTKRLLPESSTAHYDNALSAGFLLEFSGMKTYWSNQQTM